MRMLLTAALAASMGLASAERCFYSVYSNRGHCKSRNDDFAYRASWDPNAIGDNNCKEITFTKGKQWSDSDKEMTDSYNEVVSENKYVATSGLKTIDRTVYNEEVIWVNFYDKDSMDDCKAFKATIEDPAKNEKVLESDDNDAMDLEEMIDLDCFDVTLPDGKDAKQLTARFDCFKSDSFPSKKSAKRTQKLKLPSAFADAAKDSTKVATLRAAIDAAAAKAMDKIEDAAPVTASPPPPTTTKYTDKFPYSDGATAASASRRVAFVVGGKEYGVVDEANDDDSDDRRRALALRRALLAEDVTYQVDVTFTGSEEGINTQIKAMDAQATLLEKNSATFNQEFVAALQADTRMDTIGIADTAYTKDDVKVTETGKSAASTVVAAATSVVMLVASMFL